MTQLYPRAQGDGTPVSITSTMLGASGSTTSVTETGIPVTVRQGAETKELHAYRKRYITDMKTLK